MEQEASFQCLVPSCSLVSAAGTREAINIHGKISGKRRGLCIMPYGVCTYCAHRLPLPLEYPSNYLCLYLCAPFSLVLKRTAGELWLYRRSQTYKICPRLYAWAPPTGCPLGIFPSFPILAISLRVCRTLRRGFIFLSSFSLTFIFFSCDTPNSKRVPRFNRFIISRSASTRSDI